MSNNFDGRVVDVVNKLNAVDKAFKTFCVAKDKNML